MVTMESQKAQNFRPSYPSSQNPTYNRPIRNTSTTNPNANPMRLLVPQNNSAEVQDSCPSYRYPSSCCMCQEVEVHLAFPRQDPYVG